MVLFTACCALADPWVPPPWIDRIAAASEQESVDTADRAYSRSWWHWDQALGNWDGLRTDLEDSGLDLDLLYFDGVKRKTAAQDLKSGKVRVHEERFNIFVLFAFVLLLLEGVLAEKQRRTRWKRPIGLAAIFIMLATGLGATSIQAADSADDAVMNHDLAER